MELSGTFPEGIENLPFLSVIVFSKGNLHGPLPSLAKFKQLTVLGLVFNRFTGTIPHDWWTARSLENINIGHNLISGSISSKIGNLRDLKYIRFEHNRFRYSSLDKRYVT